jgi:DNA repair exonuclease SbcCD ATPase subunit
MLADAQKKVQAATERIKDGQAATEELKTASARATALGARVDEEDKLANALDAWLTQNAGRTDKADADIKTGLAVAHAAQPVDLAAFRELVAGIDKSIAAKQKKSTTDADASAKAAAALEARKQAVKDAQAEVEQVKARMKAFDGSLKQLDVLIAQANDAQSKKNYPQVYVSLSDAAKLLDTIHLPTKHDLLGTLRSAYQKVDAEQDAVGRATEAARVAADAAKKSSADAQQTSQTRATTILNGFAKLPAAATAGAA